MATDAAVNYDADREIERYLADERRAGARRILRVGVAGLLFGGLGLVPLYHWFVDGGVAPRLLFASPLLLVLGAILTPYGLLLLARAQSAAGGASSPR